MQRLGKQNVLSRGAIGKVLLSEPLSRSLTSLVGGGVKLALFLRGKRSKERAKSRQNFIEVFIQLCRYTTRNRQVSFNAIVYVTWRQRHADLQIRGSSIFRVTDQNPAISGRHLNFTIDDERASDIFARRSLFPIKSQRRSGSGWRLPWRTLDVIARSWCSGTCRCSRWRYPPGCLPGLHCAGYRWSPPPGPPGCRQRDP